MKTLVIAEKPSVAGDIARALGGCTQAQGYWEGRNVIVAAARGHLVGIGCSQETDPGFNLDKLPVIPERFALSPVEKAGPVLKLLASLARREDVSTVVNACDAGREGELIFRLIYGYLRMKQPVERMWFTTMTADGIRAAWESRRTNEQMMPLAAAARSRAEADWLIGVNGTRALTCSNMIAPGKVAHAGRVQTPTLAIVVDRELARLAFKPQDFWQVIATLQVKNGTWSATWTKTGFVADPNNPASQPDRLFDRTRAQEIIDRCKGVHPSSVVDETSPEQRHAPPLFDLTLLQREANKLFGFSAKRTLDIAQALYERHKVLSYPRTDSRHLPEDYPPTVQAIFGQIGGRLQAHADKAIASGWVTSKHRNFDNSKISDHFAIIPTTTVPRELEIDERKIYDLVATRFVASFFPAAQFQKTVRTAMIAADCFRATGRVMVSAGWLAVAGTTGQDEDKTPSLPAMAPEEGATTEDVKLHTGRTKPPPRFTEATLLGAMEAAGQLLDDDELAAAMKERGLGTPATRANIIEELLSERKQYMVRDKKELAPSSKGIDLITKLRATDLHILTSPQLTGEWEARLKKIETGKDSREAFMADVKAMAAQMVAAIKQKAVAGPERPISAERQPPRLSGKTIMCACGKADVASLPRSWQCPACKWTLWKEVSGRDMETEVLGQLCRDGTTDLLSGFVSRKNQRAFSAVLIRTDTGVEFRFPDR